MDAGVVDAGVVDAGVVDAGVVDAGVVDAGALGPAVKAELHRSELGLAAALHAHLLRLGAEVVRALDPARVPRGAAGRADRVHTCRKRLKELRALLRMLAPRLPEGLAEQRLVAASALADELGGARDGAVLRHTLASLGADPELAGEEQDEAGPWMAAALVQHHAAARALLASLQDLDLDEQGWGLVGRGLRQSWEQGRRRMRRAREEGTAVALHCWRSRAKARMYQERWLVPTWPGLLAARGAELDRLAELLGDHHDLEVLVLRLGPALPDPIRQRARARQAELAATALGLGARLYAGSGRAWERGLRAGWRAWSQGH